MESAQFYLSGTDTSAARRVSIGQSWQHDAIKKAVGAEFHIAQPHGISFHSLLRELFDAQDILSELHPVAVRIDGQSVREPRGSEGLPLVGNFYEIYPDHLGNHWRLFRKYGSVIKTTSMGKTTYLTDSPDVAQVVFTESAYFTKFINSKHPLFGLKDNTALFVNDTETENWRLAHKYMPPAFGPKAVRHYAPTMQESARKSFPIFDELDQRGEAWNVYQFMVKLAAEAIGRFVLGTNFDHFSSIDTPIHPMITNMVSTLSLNKKISSRGDWYRMLPFGDPARLHKFRRKVYEDLNEMLEKAPQGGIADQSLSEAAVNASCVADYLLNAVDEKGERFPKTLVMSNVLIATGAGYTTTSALMSWLLYSIVTYPGEQQKLLQELVDKGIGAEVNWTPELAHGLPYLDKFVKETQRLHNASFQPARTTKTEVILPGGYQIPPDSVVIPALYAIHTNPDIWRDPFRFDTSRWDTDEVANRHRCAYIPFATGPRGCIGFNFALLEVKILLSELLYRYEFKREGLEPVEYDPEFQLVRPLNFYVVAKRRTEWPGKSAE